MTDTATFPALGTTATVVVTDPDTLPIATRLLRTELAAIDMACSRFRDDSEISRLPAGQACMVSPLLAEALGAALRAARLTDGLVDPTVGGAMSALGYDRDFASIPDEVDLVEIKPAPGWHRVRLSAGAVVLPRGVHLDLGATAKALAADRAAATIAQHTGCGTMVSLGGDISIAGPTGHWQIAIGDDHTTTDPETTITLTGGGLATSGITRRRWLRAGRPVHHIVDPRTGDIPRPRWRTVSVAARSCVDANTASTAAIVLGDGAVEWLAARRLPARLVATDGAVHTVAGWPAELERAS